jgi:transposase
MITPPANTRIWIAAGVTDMRRGFTGLSALVQTALEQDPLSGHVFCFRGRRGDLIKLIWSMATAFVYLPSDLNAHVLYGRRQRAEQFP